MTIDYRLRENPLLRGAEPVYKAEVVSGGTIGWNELVERMGTVR